MKRASPVSCMFLLTRKSQTSGQTACYLRSVIPGLLLPSEVFRPGKMFLEDSAGGQKFPNENFTGESLRSVQGMGYGSSSHLWMGEATHRLRGCGELAECDLSARSGDVISDLT